MDEIAVLIPCYNEEQTIEKVIRDWKKELPELPKERLARFMEMTGIAEDEAEVLVSSRTMADFFEEAAKDDFSFVSA